MTTSLQARILAEDSQAAQRILADWPAVMKQSLESWGTDLKVCALLILLRASELTPQWLLDTIPSCSTHI